MAQKDNNIWRFTIESDKKYMGLIPHSLAYFHGKFVGRPMKEGWELPPLQEVSGKSKKLPDFIGWMIGSPIVSKKAKDVLEPVIGSFVEFLEYHPIRGKPFFVMNVITLMDDFLDVEKSDIFYTRSGKKIIAIYKAFFKTEMQKSLPPIFKLSIYPSDIYVSEPFVQVVIDHQLTGAAMADPQKKSLDFILKGITENIVPGVPTIK